MPGISVKKVFYWKNMASAIDWNCVFLIFGIFMDMFVIFSRLCWQRYLVLHVQKYILVCWWFIRLKKCNQISLGPIYLFIYLFVLIYKPRETIQCAALFSHGTQVAMFSWKCRACISISKTSMGTDPKRKNIKQKITKTATLSKRVAKKQAQKENYKN